MTISDVMLMLQPRIAIEYAAALEHGDAMDSILGQESENGRLARLLIKLGFVNERPDVSCHGFGHVTCFLWVHRVCVCVQQDGDRTWAETGDRYLLKLFRDYVFHQVRVCVCVPIVWAPTAVPYLVHGPRMTKRAKRRLI